MENGKNIVIANDGDFRIDCSTERGSTSKTDALVLQLHITENCLDRPYMTMKRFKNKSDTLPKTEFNFWVGEQRRFHVRSWIEERSLSHWVGSLTSIRSIGGGPDILIGHPARGAEIQLKTTSFNGAMDDIRHHALALVEVDAPRYA